MRRGWWIAKFLVFGIIALMVIGLVTQGLWNWLVPTLFAGPVLSFWQALGILALSKILFWSFGKGGGHWRQRRGPWMNYWGRKWQDMSPEERDKFKQKMWEKWCPEEKTGTDSGSGGSIV